jgi:hypothetical protein
MIATVIQTVAAVIQAAAAILFFITVRETRRDKIIDRLHGLWCQLPMDLRPKSNQVLIIANIRSIFSI